MTPTHEQIAATLEEAMLAWMRGDLGGNAVFPMLVDAPLKEYEIRPKDILCQYCGSLNWTIEIYVRRIRSL